MRTINLKSKNTTVNPKVSIVKGTKEGALYLDVRELFEQSDVRELINKLAESNIRKRILELKKA